MGGGGSSTGMPTSGGMTVYNQLGYDPSQPQGGGINWWGLAGQSLQSAGKGIAGAQTPIPSPQVPDIAQAQIGENQSQPAYIQQNNLIEALLRLLGGGQG